MRGNRLDALHNDSIFDIVESTIGRSSLPFLPLHEVSESVNDRRNPLEKPYEEFLYVDIAGVDTLRAVPRPRRMLGKDATSSRMRQVMYEGHILLSKTRPTRNAICVVPPELDNQICSTGFEVLRPYSAIRREFLLLALRTELTRMQLESLCSGSGYPAINPETDLPAVLIPCPGLSEQDRILEEVTTIREEATQLDEEASEIRQEIDEILTSKMDISYRTAKHASCFSREGKEGQSLAFFRWPQEVSDRLNYLFYHPKTTEIMTQLTDNYSTVHLGEICMCPIYRGVQPQYSENGSYRVLKTAQLQNEYLDYDHAPRISHEFFNEQAEWQVREGDILIASTGYGSLGKVDIYDRSTPSLVDGHISVLRVSAEYDPYFIAYFLRSIFGKTQFDKWFNGSSGQIEIQPEDLGRFIVPSAYDGGIPIDQQNEIAYLISNIIRNSLELEKRAESRWNMLITEFSSQIV